MKKNKFFLFTFLRVSKDEMPGEVLFRWFRLDDRHPDAYLGQYLSSMYGSMSYDACNNKRFHFDGFYVEIQKQVYFETSLSLCKWIAKHTMIVNDFKPKVNFFVKDENGNDVKCLLNVVSIKLNGSSKYKEVGIYDDDGNFVRGHRNTLQEDRHKLRKIIKGWAINKTVFEKMPGEYVIINTDKGRYRAHKMKIEKSGVPISCGQAGYEPQIGIKDALFEKMEEGSAGHTGQVP